MSLGVVMVKTKIKSYPLMIFLFVLFYKNINSVDVIQTIVSISRQQQKLMRLYRNFHQVS